jgi:hypothetical protein
MKFIIGILLLPISLSAIAADYPDSLTGEQLWSICEGEKSNSEKCKTFISGVRSGMAAQRMFIGYTLATQKNEDSAKLLLWLTTNEPICSKQAITNQQVVEAFIAHMKNVKKDNPKLLSGGAGVSVLLGAQQKYPCN